MIAHVEYTDLYAGEPNYCWVRRFDFDCSGMSDLAIIRKAKSELSISGKRAKHGWDGEDIARYFQSTVLFITFDY